MTAPTPTAPRERVLVLGAAGRDFHDVNVLYRDDPRVEVVAITATQIPDISGRTYPPALAGPLYPDGIRIVPEDELEDLVRRECVDTVVLAYSDLSHAQVMHLASRAIAAGADFRVPGWRSTALRSRRPVVAVTAVRTGVGKSQTTRYVAGLLQAAGQRVVAVRHPMPYGDLAAQACQRFETVEDLVRAPVHDRGARGVRAAHRRRGRRLRRRRLRADPARGGGRGRRGALGRRQQRPPVLPARPAPRARRPPAPGRRGGLPPRGGQRADGRRRARREVRLGAARGRRGLEASVRRPTPAPRCCGATAP